jgi:hypothetical protein
MMENHFIALAAKLCDFPEAEGALTILQGKENCLMVVTTMSARSMLDALIGGIAQIEEAYPDEQNLKGLSEVIHKHLTRRGV